ncbi:hypothetical protein M885DRAFT_521897 [Pelagophyceae sp. CCMP2097]|nr:hypothetical protein M885DRAFT_521897 [Pelagophyceae sp. CCMP2097]
MDMLRKGDFKMADQFTRDNLIFIADAKERGFVYWTDVNSLPKEDMATMENLWMHYSDGKFGFTVQKRIWRQQGDNFEKFCTKIMWTKEDADTGSERKRKWFGTSEFIYNLEDAPKGHLPLTSALRGTQLLKSLLKYPLWESEDLWKREM